MSTADISRYHILWHKRLKHSRRSVEHNSPRGRHAKNLNHVRYISLEYCISLVYLISKSTGEMRQWITEVSGMPTFWQYRFYSVQIEANMQEGTKSKKGWDHSDAENPPHDKHRLESILLYINTHVDGCCTTRWGIVKVSYSQHIKRYGSESLKNSWHDERSQILAAVVRLITRAPFKH